MEKCAVCGLALDPQFWGALGKCHLCYFKGDPTIPERVRTRIGRAALEIDAHAKIGHGILKAGEECRNCMMVAWVAFCEAREIMGMGNTWTQYQRVTQPSGQKVIQL